MGLVAGPGHVHKPRSIPDQWCGGRGGGHGPPSDNFLGVLKSKGSTKISQLPM